MRMPNTASGSLHWTLLCQHGLKMAAVVLTLSPGGGSTPASHAAPAESADGVLSLSRFASGTLTFTNKLCVGSAAVAVLTLRNPGSSSVTVSCKARRSAGGQLQLPGSTAVPGGSEAQVEVVWKPTKEGEQRLSFDVCGSKLGRLPVQVFGAVVSAEIASGALPLRLKSCD